MYKNSYSFEVKRAFLIEIVSKSCGKRAGEGNIVHCEQKKMMAKCGGIN